MTKKLIFFLFLGALVVAGAALFRTLPSGQQFLWEVSGGGAFLLPLISVAALLDSVNPCAFSILILTIAFLFSAGAVSSRIVKIGSFYILGIFAVYLLIGLGILQTLHLFNTPHFMAKLGATFLVLFGLINIINEFFPAFPVKLKIPAPAHRKIAELMEQASLPAAFLLGSLVGLCEFPCTGGPYLLALGLLHDQATYLKGAGYLVLYNLIFILPLVIILAVASDETLLARVEAWQQKERKVMRLWGGAAMVALGIIVFLL